MKSRMQAQSYFYEDPSERTFLQLVDVLEYESIKGNITKEYAAKILEAAKKYMLGE